ncbi:MAG: acyl carrier protein [Gammaproteobacteria bacterium]|jgi:acyl carrier protein
MLIDEIIQVLGDVLVLGNRAGHFSNETELLGSLPEFDSMAVVSVLTALEEQYGITIDDDDIDASIFETVETLTSFISDKLSA